MDKNPSYPTKYGNATKDLFFLLSIAEAKKYFVSEKMRRDRLRKAIIMVLYRWRLHGGRQKGRASGGFARSATLAITPLTVAAVSTTVAMF